MCLILVTRDGPMTTDLAEFAQGLAAEFSKRMKVFAEKSDSSVFYDPEAQQDREHAFWEAVDMYNPPVRPELGWTRTVQMPYNGVWGMKGANEKETGVFRRWAGNDHRMKNANSHYRRASPKADKARAAAKTY